MTNLSEEDQNRIDEHLRNITEPVPNQIDPKEQEMMEAEDKFVREHPDPNTDIDRPCCPAELTTEDQENIEEFLREQQSNAANTNP